MESANSTKMSQRGFCTIERTAASTSKRGKQTPSKQGNVADAEKVRPKLTLEQQLRAIERLQKGDYIKGAGLLQFYDEPESTTATTSAGCRVNLMKEFEKVRDTKTNEGVGEPILSSTVNLDELPRAHHMDLYMLESVEDYADFPSYIKQLDKVIVLHHVFVKDIMKLCELRSETAFQQMFPQYKIEKLFSDIVRITRILRKFLKKPFLKQTELFLQKGSTKANTKKEKETSKIYCEVQDQEKFIACLHKIPDLIKRLSTTMEKLNSSPQLAGRIEKMQNLMDSMEDLLQSTSNLTKEHENLVKKAEDFEDGRVYDGDLSGTSTDDSPFSSPL